MARPQPSHISPRDAQARLDAILDELSTAAERREQASEAGTLFEATQGWVVERKREKDLKRTTLTGYEAMFERLYRDLGAETPVREFADGRLRDYFDDFKSYRVISEKTAKRARREGKEVELIEVQRWTAQPRESVPIEVASKAEAVRIADELPGTWHHLRRGAYRIVPLNARRAKIVSFAEAKVLEAEGWLVSRSKKECWMPESVHPAGSCGARASMRDEASIPIASRGPVPPDASARSNPPVPVPRSSSRSSRLISASSIAASSARRSSGSCQS